MTRPWVEWVLPLVSAYAIVGLRPANLVSEDLRARLLRRTLAAGVLSYVLVGSVQAWPVAIAAALVHLAFDVLAVRKPARGLGAFVLTQVGRLTLILAIAFVVQARNFFPQLSLWRVLIGDIYYAALLIATGVVVCVPIGGVVVGFVVKPLLDQLEQARSVESDEENEGGGLLARGFSEGGRIIGYLERAIIYLFILVGQPAGIGFLIAAKSIFRFGELREGANRMEAEYILIGTFLSFLYGLVVSYLVVMLLHNL
jgi:hypothetical protein